VNRRDRADAAAAVAVLLEPGSGGERRQLAKAALAGLGIDPDTAVARAREEAARPRLTETLRKDAAAAGRYVVRAPMGGGQVLGLEMTPAEAASLVTAVQDAMGGRPSWI
jgi:hypothetical protein